MSDRRFQAKLNRMGKAKGNTVSIEDGPQEVHEFIQDNAKNPGQAQDAYILGRDTFKQEPPTEPPTLMATPLYKKMTCWKGYVAKGKKKSPSGKRTKGGKIKMVNNCVKK